MKHPQEVAEVQQRLDCARQALTEAQVTEANAKLDLEAAEAAVGAYRASGGSPDTSRQNDTEYKPSEPSGPEESADPPAAETAETQEFLPDPHREEAARVGGAVPVDPSRGPFAHNAPPLSLSF